MATTSHHPAPARQLTRQLTRLASESKDTGIHEDLAAASIHRSDFCDHAACNVVHHNAACCKLLKVTQGVVACMHLHTAMQQRQLVQSVCRVCRWCGTHAKCQAQRWVDRDRNLCGCVGCLDLDREKMGRIRFGS